MNFPPMTSSMSSADKYTHSYYAADAVFIEDYELGPTIPGKWGSSSKGIGATVTWSFMGGGTNFSWVSSWVRKPN